MPDSQPYEDATVHLSATPPTPSSPRRIGQYEIIRDLGEGGMGMVVLGRDSELRRDVAIKLVRAELLANQIFIERLLREARLSAALNHPNIVTVYQVGREGIAPYIVMEFVEGKSLRDLLRTPPPVTIGRILDIILQCCDGLDAAARKGIVHRDFKPANVMVRDDGLVKIMDFGLSKDLAADGDSLTATSAVMGTPHYMSPEQAAGRAVDFRTDVYALGITIFQCITGYLPFRSTSVFEMLRQHAEAALPDDPRLMAIAGGELMALIRDMTAKVSDARLSSYAEIAQRIRRVMATLSPEELGQSNRMGPTFEPPSGSGSFPHPQTALPSLSTNPTVAAQGKIPKSASDSGIRKRSPMAIIGIMLVAGLLLAGGAWFAVDHGWAPAVVAGKPLATPTPAPTIAPTPASMESTPGLVRPERPAGGVTLRPSPGVLQTAADLLASLGTHGLNLKMGEGIDPRRIPLVAGFHNRSPEEVLDIFCFAVSWQAVESDGVLTVNATANDPYRAIADDRRLTPPHELPSVSINSMAVDLTMRQCLGALAQQGKIDYLIVGQNLPNSKVPAFSLTNTSLGHIMREISDNATVPFEWTWHKETLVAVEFIAPARPPAADGAGPPGGGNRPAGPASGEGGVRQRPPRPRPTP